MKGRKATIAEVARRAGVSTATAGRVLGGYGYSSPEMRKKVLAAAKALAYRPNLLARSLITGRTRTIGVVTGDIENPFYATILRGIANVLEPQNVGMLITNSDEDAERERHSVELLLEAQVDGLVISPCQSAGTHLHEAAQTVPVVLIDREMPGLAVDSVGVDNVGGARDAVAALLTAGHRRVAILAELEHGREGGVGAFLDAAERGAAEVEGLYPSWHRLLGYVIAHAEAGVPIDRGLVRRVGEYSVAAAERAAVDLFGMAERPSALFTADGTMSGGAMAAIWDQGLRVPDDISLIAFDDLDWMAFAGPGIDAVAQPRRAMGETAAQMLQERIAGYDGPPRRADMPTRWVCRGSVRRAGQNGGGDGPQTVSGAAAR